MRIVNVKVWNGARAGIRDGYGFMDEEEIVRLRMLYKEFRSDAVYGYLARSAADEGRPSFANISIGGSLSISNDSMREFLARKYFNVVPLPLPSIGKCPYTFLLGNSLSEKTMGLYVAAESAIPVIRERDIYHVVGARPAHATDFRAESYVSCEMGGGE